VTKLRSGPALSGQGFPWADFPPNAVSRDEQNLPDGIAVEVGSLIHQLKKLALRLINVPSAD
jgi:hypothetical protein